MGLHFIETVITTGARNVLAGDAPGWSGRAQEGEGGERGRLVIGSMVIST